MKGALSIDGKLVRKFLFARLTRLRPVGSGFIPTDDGRRFIVLVQVEAFSKDHAFKRLNGDLFPNVPRSDWDFLEELDAEHDIGMMGQFFPLDPLAIRAPFMVQ